MTEHLQIEFSMHGVLWTAANLVQALSAERYGYFSLDIFFAPTACFIAADPDISISDGLLGPNSGLELWAPSNFGIPT